MIVDDGPAAERPAPTVVRVDGAAWQVVQPGAVSEEALRRQAACLVVFVCTGNTCRSPLAEGLCKARAERPRLLPAAGRRSDFHILSAGSTAWQAGPLDERVEGGPGRRTAPTCAALQLGRWRGRNWPPRPITWWP